MSNSLITIWRTTASESGEDQALRAQSLTAITFDELKYWLKTGKFWGKVFRHGKSVLRVHDLDLMGRPFAVCLLVWLLARGKSLVRDDRGREISLGPFVILNFLRKQTTDAARIPALVRKVTAQVERLEDEPASAGKLDISRRPVYLRTDLTFGLLSGGSVGHIAGVLNHLDEFSGLPVFLTTDRIPTVKDPVEIHRVVPGPDFWNFPEELTLSFNDLYFDRVEELSRPVAVSFVYQRYGLNNFSGVQLARKRHVPLVLEFNGSAVWVGRQWQRGLKHEALSEKIEMLNLRRADLVVVVSRALRDSLRAKGIPDEKILVNPNGVDPDIYSPKADGSGVRKKYGLEGKKVLGFIGTFGQWHGAEVLAESFGRLTRAFPEFRDQVRLLMVGDGITMPRVKETFRTYGVQDICRLTGTIPQAEGPAHLAACDLLVSPTVPNRDGTAFFGSPTKLFEYMAMGKAIVASNLDQIGEVLAHHSTAWMVEPGKPERLMMGLKILLDDPELCSRLGAAARKEVVAKYTWKEHTRKIVENLKERCPSQP